MWRRTRPCGGTSVRRGHEGGNGMDKRQERLDDIRRERSDVENHLIDELRAGKISRREFIRRGTVVGMSIPLVAFIASACGGGSSGGTTSAPSSASSGPAKAGGTITV